MIGEYHVPPSYYESTCVSFSTESDDRVELLAVVDPGPQPPGPTRMKVTVYLNDRQIQSDILDAGQHANTLISPGGEFRVCAYAAPEEPYNWDSDDEGYVQVRHQRKKPNLVVLGPTIHFGERWVGYGYRVENNSVRGGHAHAALHYAKRHETGGGVVLDQISSHAIRKGVGTLEDWNSVPGKYRVSFSDLGLPPDEATDLLASVDLERSVDELSEHDNISWHDLPHWRGTLTWTDTSVASVPTSVPRGKTEKKRQRLMRVYSLRLRATQEIWNQIVPARHRCSLRVYVSSVGPDAGGRHRGWIFPPSMRSALKGERISIGDNVRLADHHPPVNALQESTRPLGATNEVSSYLFIPCDQLDTDSGELALLYIPATTAGTDRIRVELWDDIRNEAIAEPIAREIAARQSFDILLERGFVASVDSTVFHPAGAAPGDPADRHIVPLRLGVRCTLNGKSLPSGYELRVRLTGRYAPDKQDLGGRPRGSGWLFPEKSRRSSRYAKRLRWASIVIKANRVSGVQPINEFKGLNTSSASGPLSRVIKTEVSDLGWVACMYLPPTEAGEDLLEFRLHRLGEKGGRSLVRRTVAHTFTIVPRKAITFYLVAWDNHARIDWRATAPATVARTALFSIWRYVRALTQVYESGGLSWKDALYDVMGEGEHLLPRLPTSVRQMIGHAALVAHGYDQDHSGEIHIVSHTGGDPGVRRQSSWEMIWDSFILARINIFEVLATHKPDGHFDDPAQFYWRLLSKALPRVMTFTVRGDEAMALIEKVRTLQAPRLNDVYIPTTETPAPHYYGLNMVEIRTVSPDGAITRIPAESPLQGGCANTVASAVHFLGLQAAFPCDAAEFNLTISMSLFRTVELPFLRGEAAFDGQGNTLDSDLQAELAELPGAFAGPDPIAVRFFDPSYLYDAMADDPAAYQKLVGLFAERQVPPSRAAAH